MKIALPRFVALRSKNKPAGKPEGLVRWQLTLAGVLGVQAVALLILSTNYAAPLHALHLTRDTLQTSLSGTPTAAPALTQLLHVNVAYVLATMLLLTGLVALLQATLYKKVYVSAIKNTWLPSRWLTLAIASSSMVGLSALLAGMSDISSLGMLKVLLLVACAAGFMNELLRTRRVSDIWLRRTVLIVAGAAAVLPLLSVLCTLVADGVLGGVVVPGYLWGLYVTVLVGMVLLGANQYAAVAKRGRWGRYAYSEYWFIGLIGLIETAFVWQVFAAVLHP